MLALKLVLSNIMLSWKKKESLNALDRTSTAYYFFKVDKFREWDASFYSPKVNPGRT